MAKLTLIECKNASCPSGKNHVRLYDENGLYLEISAISKRWFLKYRIAGTERRYAIGIFPDVSLQQARESRDEARKLVEQGVDPVTSRKEAKIALRMRLGTTFESVSLQWHKDWKAAHTDRHASYVLRRLEADAFPIFGTRPIADITAPQLIAMAKKIESRNASHLARRVWQTCNQVFRYAIAHGLIERNPCTDVKPGDALKSYKRKNYARLDAKDMPELLRKIETYNGSPYTRLALKLMALTFVRTGELIGATWDEFEGLDSREPLWRIPAQRMKMDMPHLVPLSPQAVEVLACLSELRTHSRYVFPGERNRKGSMSNNTILYALYRLGYRGRMTGHGFRGVASTILHELGWRHDIIEIQLAHQERNQVSAAYNHATYVPDRRKMMQAWADHLDALRRA